MTVSADNLYLYIIIAFLPLTSIMLVLQTNPYYALVMRAILGAVAVLVYAVLGGADVALTEALVGTLLSVILYVIAVRSSFVIRLGIEEEIEEELIQQFKTIIQKYHLRLELIPYSNTQTLKEALETKTVHGICHALESSAVNQDAKYTTAIRVERFFNILKTELSSPLTHLSYIAIPTPGEKQS